MVSFTTEPFFEKISNMFLHYTLLFKPLSLFSYPSKFVPHSSPFNYRIEDFVFKSPCFNHLRQAFYCNNASWLWLFLLCFANNHFLSSLPTSSHSLSSSFVSISRSLLWISFPCWEMLLKTSLFQTFKSDFNTFKFYWKTNIPLPCTS